MSSDVLLRDTTDDGVAVLTLNRPDRLNAWTTELEHAYFGALEDCAHDPDVRVIVVTGAGRGFCAGADMNDLQGLGSGEIDADARHAERRPQSFPTTIPKPVIAAINGPVAGIGLVQALMCDLRFAAAGAKFTTAFSRRGLIAEHGISYILPRLIGPAKALDLLFSARVFLAEEAQALGLVNQVFAPEQLLDETMTYARDLAANCSPTSMAVMKQQVYAALDQERDTALDIANKEMFESFARADFREGVASFVEKRPPAFPPVGAATSAAT